VGVWPLVVSYQVELAAAMVRGIDVMVSHAFAAEIK